MFSFEKHLVFFREAPLPSQTESNAPGGGCALHSQGQGRLSLPGTARFAGTALLSHPPQKCSSPSRLGTCGTSSRLSPQRAVLSVMQPVILHLVTVCPSWLPLYTQAPLQAREACAVEALGRKCWLCPSREATNQLPARWGLCSHLTLTEPSRSKEVKGPDHTKGLCDLSTCPGSTWE